MDHDIIKLFRLLDHTGTLTVDDVSVYTDGTIRIQLCDAEQWSGGSIVVYNRDDRSFMVIDNEHSKGKVIDHGQL